MRHGPPDTPAIRRDEQRRPLSDVDDRAPNGWEPALTRWEQAYRSFETKEQELRKFIRRLRMIGADGWRRDSRIVEVCSGHGTGLHAWRALGFGRLLGVDYSPALVRSQPAGAGLRLIGDARMLPLATSSADVAVVQGGLHHLFSSDDVEKTVREMCRVVVPGGRIVIIEPWLTPFLRFVHFVCRRPGARRLSRKLDALAIMIEEERQTYERWLNAPNETLAIVHRHVAPQFVRLRWGKLVVVGSPAHP